MTATDGACPWNAGMPGGCSALTCVGPTFELLDECALIGGGGGDDGIIARGGGIDPWDTAGTCCSDGAGISPECPGIGMMPDMPLGTCAAADMGGGKARSSNTCIEVV